MKIDFKFIGYTDNIETLDWTLLYDSYEWIREMRGVIQDPIHHAEGDVEAHTRMVLIELLKLDDFKSLDPITKKILFVAVLLHDVEKRSTTVVDENGRVSSPNHAKKGEFTARQMLYRKYDVPFHAREEICKLVRYHGRPIWFMEKKDPVHEVIKLSHLLNTQSLYLLAKADMLGRECQDKDEMLLRVEMFKEHCIDNDCFGRPYEFKNHSSRKHYFDNGGYPDYVPFQKQSYNVILMSGIPCAGKDTLIRSYGGEYAVISLDDIRKEMKVKPTDKSGNGRVVQEAKERAKELLRLNKPFIWNATNITFNMRQQLIEMFNTYGADVTIVYVEAPYYIILKRNIRRDEDALPRAAIERMIDKLDVPTIVECNSLILHVQE